MNIEKVNLGFIGFDVNEGDHVVEFRYKTQGKTLGLIISFACLAILIISCVLSRKRDKSI